jgi:two-component system, sensor histidine kinase PdtaS
LLATLRATRRWPLWVRLILATACLVSVHLLEIPLEREIPGEPFLLFFLAVMILTLAFGQGVGLYGAGLSTLLSVFFFEPGTLALHHAVDLVRVELYALLAAGSVVALARLVNALIAADETARTLEQSQRANSVLLRELAHRVANNFASVASLIRSRAKLVDDAEAKSVLNEAVEQVMVLARVHALLRAESGGVGLDSKVFMEELCDDLQVLVPRGQSIAVRRSAVEHRLAVAQAIPMGLIVNELVTNAIKYAFPNGRQGTIRVELQDAGDSLCLRVEDDGVGLGDGGVHGTEHGTGMGHELVRALCQQLGGKLEVDSSRHGSTFRVLFHKLGGEAAPAGPPTAAPMLH